MKICRGKIWSYTLTGTIVCDKCQNNEMKNNFNLSDRMKQHEEAYRKLSEIPKGDYYEGKKYLGY